MRIRSVVVFLAIGVLIQSAGSLFARAERIDVCCSDDGVCGGKRCCDPTLLGLPECSP